MITPMFPQKNEEDKWLYKSQGINLKVSICIRLKFRYSLDEKAKRNMIKVFHINDFKLIVNFLLKWKKMILNSKQKKWFKIQK